MRCIRNFKAFDLALCREKMRPWRQLSCLAGTHVREHQAIVTESVGRRHIQRHAGGRAGVDFEHQAALTVKHEVKAAKPLQTQNGRQLRDGLADAPAHRFADGHRPYGATKHEGMATHRAHDQFVEAEDGRFATIGQKRHRHRCAIDPFLKISAVCWRLAICVICFTCAICHADVPTPTAMRLLDEPIGW